MGLRGLVGRLVGDGDGREIARIEETVEQVNLLEPEYAALSDTQLRAKTDLFRERLSQEGSLDGLLVETFAAVREAARRTIGLRPYDVQLIGGVILHQGKIVEMKTGEGKTLVAAMPLYLNALQGEGVHLVTVNDYLARRDGGWMGPVFEALGVTVGLVIPGFSGLFDSAYVDPASHFEDERLVHWRPVPRQEAYGADITYGTSNEFGFDYLRDNTALDLEACVQRPLHFAIIDEVDNILVDEARTPLIISGPVPRRVDKYMLFDAIAARLRRNTAAEDEPPNGDFELDERSRAVFLTELGIERVEEELRKAQEIRGDESIYDPRHFDLVHFLENALKARHVFRRDVDYVVTESQEVVLVDSRTGRLMPGRRYSEGLHQAIEGKERVRIRSETVTIATITIQKYFRLYGKLAGMTGTAVTEREEFREIYDLDVVELPTNVAYRARSGALDQRRTRLGDVEGVSFGGIDSRYGGTQVTVYDAPDGSGRFFERVDFPDVIYLNEEAKLKAVVGEIAEIRQTGRPVLVGTTSVESSERLHTLLRRAGIEHSVLNAKRHTEEALIIAQAGQPGAVTVATSMAGRGTDIILGGNPEGLAARYINEQCFDVEQLGEVVRLAVSDRPAEARKIASNGGPLGLETVAWAEKAQQEFANRSTQVESRGLVTAVVPAALERFGGTDEQPERHRTAEAVRAVVASIRRGHLRTAREQALQAGLPPEQVDWIVKWIQDQYAYRQHPAQFLTGELFSRHYNARMALVRAVLAGDAAQAQAIVAAAPDLGQKLIEGIERIQSEWADKRRQVATLGGLHILGTERYEARRIDDQFRGRAARQGDPGTSRFYLSLEDELMRRFASESVTGLIERFGGAGDVPLEAGVLTKTVESAQRRLEGYYFDIRKHLVQYDEVVSRQRELIYGERREILSGGLTDLRQRIRRYFEEELDHLASLYLDDPEAWMMGEVQAAIADYSSPDSDEPSVNASAVARRLRGLLPQLDPSSGEAGDTAQAEALREQLAAIVDPDTLGYELGQLVRQAVEERHHLALFLRSVGALMPLWPRVQFVHAGGRAQWEETRARHAVEQEALGFHVITLVNLDSPATVAESAEEYRSRVAGFLEALLGATEGSEPEHTAAALIDRAIGEAFERLQGLAAGKSSRSELDPRLGAVTGKLARDVGAALATAVESLPAEQVSPLFLAYYDRVLAQWEQHVADRGMRGFLRRFGMVRADREEERLLRGPTQVDQELSQGIRDAIAAHFEDAAPMPEEHWQAAWHSVKRAYRADQFDRVADAPLGEYEAAFAAWLAREALDAWRARGGLPVVAEAGLLAQKAVALLAQTRQRLANLELEEFFRWLVLTRMDREWIQYLEEIDDLRQGIGLQAYGQRSPEVEFRRQAFDMFDSLRAAVQLQIIRGFFVELPNYHQFVQRQREMMRARQDLASSEYRMVTSGKARPRRSHQRVAAGESVTLVRDMRIGRNDPCWCGSGKKYKLCHMRQDMESRGAPAASTRPPQTSGRKQRRRR